MNLSWQELIQDFFENPQKERIGSLLGSFFPWDLLKNLKAYLYDLVGELPKLIPTGEPLRESLFITIEGEIIPFREIKQEEGRYLFRGDEVRGAIIQTGAILLGRRIKIEEGVVIEPTALIEEPAYFSRNSKVRHGAYVRGSVYVGEEGLIGHTTEIKNSILFAKAKAPHFAYVGDSILGQDVNLGAGTKLANLKFHKKEITFEIQGVKVATGLKKMGAILGDRVQTGCNSVLSPGTLLGKDSIVYPGVTVPSGYFSPKTKIKA